jgi:hypothetical protein
VEWKGPDRSEKAGKEEFDYDWKGEAMIRVILPPDFLSALDSLANSGSCLELNTAWDQIRNRAEEIDPEGLNELWGFYFERLAECEKENP